MEVSNCTIVMWENILVYFLKMYLGDFPGGRVDKNPPANAGDVGSIPRPGRFHVPQGN